MRTLSEILDIAKSGGKPKYDELRYALLAMEALSIFDADNLRQMASDFMEGKTPRLMTPKWMHEKSYTRWQTALAKSPKEYLGHNNDPDNPLVQKRRKASAEMWSRLAKEAQGE